MKKYFFLTLSIIVILALIIFLYFYSILDENKQIEKQMIRKAYQNISILEKVEEFHYFSGEKQYYIILGKDNLTRQIFIWLNDEEIDYKILLNWVKKEEIKKQALIIAPDILIKRITPGIDGEGKLIYEILFKDKDGKLGYQYFYLESGEFIKMYRLGKAR